MEAGSRGELTRLGRIADHSSVEERNAAEAERDSIDLQKVEFMSDHLGDEFDGKVSGVTVVRDLRRLDKLFVRGSCTRTRAVGRLLRIPPRDKYALIGRKHGAALPTGGRGRCAYSP